MEGNNISNDFGAVTCWSDTGIEPWFALCLAITMFLVIAANILIIVALFKVQIYKTKRVVAPYFALSLSVSDLVIGSILLPSNIVLVVVNPNTLGITFCGFHGYISAALFTTTLSNLLIISLDRYVCVLHPLKYKSLLKPRRAMVLIILAWLYGLVCAALPICLGSNYKYNCVLRGCFLDLGKAEGIPASIVLFVFSYSLPLSVILYTNLRIYRTARLRSRKINEWHNNDPKYPPPSSAIFTVSNQNISHRDNEDENLNLNVPAVKHVVSATPAPPTSTLEKRLSMAILLILIVIVVLQTPYHVLLVSAAIGGHASNNVFITFRVFTWMIYCNSLLNAAIYSYINTNFRRRLKQITCGRDGSKKLPSDKNMKEDLPHCTRGDKTLVYPVRVESLNSDIFGQYSMVISRHTPTDSLVATYSCSSFSPSSPETLRETNAKENVKTKERDKNLSRQLSQILLPSQRLKRQEYPRTISKSLAWMSSDSRVRNVDSGKRKKLSGKSISKRFWELDQEMGKWETCLNDDLSSAASVVN
uniref:Histamine H2 receptor-like n=1 Tax=Saccoglossus kowalevskii TaxID=10224 RepID=A0ABM0LUF0_SACKO|nr:PREDICTED: histamine H2 receptor-like [Saccoglossus kowalevskii]